MGNKIQEKPCRKGRGEGLDPCGLMSGMSQGPRRMLIKGLLKTSCAGEFLGGSAG